MATRKATPITRRDAEREREKGPPAGHPQWLMENADFMVEKAQVLELQKGLNDPGGPTGSMGAIRRSRERAD